MLAIDSNNPQIQNLKSCTPCRVIVRNGQDPPQIAQFVMEGLQIGQQVVAMAGPRFLRELAQGLNESGMRPEILLRNGRLVFLTAPNCLSMLIKPDDPLQRGPLRPNAPLLRWVSDWSWAYGKGSEPMLTLEYQRRVHDFIRSLGALSLCSVQSDPLDRNSMLALLADHRRALRGGEHASRAASATFAAGAGH